MRHGAGGEGFGPRRDPGLGAEPNLVYDSTIDGSGGFLGANGDACITLVHSSVTTMVQSVDNARIGFIHSALLPHPTGIPSYLTLSGNGSAALMETKPPQVISLNGGFCLPYISIYTWQPDVS